MSGAPTERFSNRVEEYRRHRPSYPPQIIDILQAEGALEPSSTVADIGAGTGLSTALFLPHAARVYGVEPNDAMRRQMQIDLAAYPNLTVTAGSAEDTGLDDASVDLIVAAQAFHWFRIDETRTEFRRILKPSGRVLLLWNERDIAGDALQREYEALLQTWISNYRNLAHKSLNEATIGDFFSARPRRFSLPNRQTLTLEALKGRMLSSSYIPKPPSPIYDGLTAGVEQLFSRFQSDGVVTFVYKTNGWLGSIV